MTSGFIFIALVFIGYDNTVLTKVIAEIWERYNKVQQGKKHEQSDNQRSC